MSGELDQQSDDKRNASTLNRIAGANPKARNTDANGCQPTTNKQSEMSIKNIL